MTPVRKTALLLILGLAVAVTWFNRERASQGVDFQAFYKGGARLLAGAEPYVFERDYAFKYPPFTLLGFAPFAALPFDAARWTYAALLLLAVLGSPFLIVKILGPQKDVVFAAALGFVAALRFLDLEFHSNQTGSLVFVLLLVGVWLIVRGREQPGIFALFAGAIVKFHTLMLFAVFRPRCWWKLLPAALVVFCLPDPRLWLEWATQIKLTTPLLDFDRGHYAMQGLYAFSVGTLGLDKMTLYPLLPSLVFYALTVWLVPKFSFEEARRQPAAFLIAVCAVVVAAIAGSPVPFQYSYAPVGAVVFASWLVADTSERVGLLVTAFLFGATPKGILGDTWAHFLEANQINLWTALLLWAVLLRQSRRLAVPDCQSAPVRYGESQALSR